MSEPDVSAPAFWQRRYERGEDGWDLGGPHPSLVHLLDTAPPPPGRVLVPGCGRGWDALALAQRGWEVVAVDFAEAAVGTARRLAATVGGRLTVAQRDLFTLGPEWTAAFDGVWEHTCFCAIDPARRDAYAALVARVLRPGGWFLACFFPLRAAGGPPFAVTPADVVPRLARHFRVERVGPPPRPVPHRAGQEWLLRARRVDAPGRP